MDSQVETLRDEIIRKFCRTVLWIDDEIDLGKGLEHPDADALFRDKFDEFTKSNLLCHMMGFPPARADDDNNGFVGNVQDVVTTCKALALQADIVIVDWMLGGQGSSTFAEEIIQSLLKKEKGFRFIVVLSQVELGESDFKKLDESFVLIRELLWKNNKGQFLLSLKKDEFKNVDLFKQVRRAILEAYPDYLHLAALEIAGRIKSFVPRWLSNMPFGTDMGILVERGNTRRGESWNAELQECIASNLIEDLATVALDDDLDAISPNMLQSVDCCAVQAIQHFDTSNDSLKTALEALKECVDDEMPICKEGEKPKRFTRAHYIALADYISTDCIKTVVEGIEAYAEFCEKRSGNEFKSGKVCPGATYEGLTKDKNAIAVCITAGCDCLRKNAFLFLVGTPIPMKNVNGETVPDYKQLHQIEGGKTVLRINKKEYVFKSEAESVVVKMRTDIQAAKMVGIVRQDILNRLIGRYMSHTQRYGVNQPDIVRRLREETDFDEKK